MDSNNKRYYIDISGITPIILPITSNSLYNVIVSNVYNKAADLQELYSQYSSFGDPQCIVIENSSHLLTFRSAREAVKFYKNIKRTEKSVQLVGMLPSTILLNHSRPPRRLVENLKLLNYVVQALIYDDNDALHSAIFDFQDFPIPQIQPVVDLCLMQKLRKFNLIDVLVADFPVFFNHNDLIELIESVLPKNSYFDFQSYNFNSQSHCPLFCIIYVSTPENAMLLIKKLSKKKLSHKCLKVFMVGALEKLLEIPK